MSGDELTSAMIDAGVSALRGAELGHDPDTSKHKELVSDIYKAMRAASPDPEAKQFGVPAEQKFGDDPASTEAMKQALEGDNAK